MLRVGSLCSGVGGIDLGFERAGATIIGQVEWDKHCQSVLRHHWPTVHIASDLKETHVRRGSADVIIGGTPCQDLSVAGARAGLDGSRSSLFFDYARVVDECQPDWFVWENVAGALTSSGGRDMGTVVATMADLGYGVAWRVLDAQYFGVAQRRRRVVLVGRRGDVRSAAEVLALNESVQGNPPSRHSARPDSATAAGPSATHRSQPTREVATTLTTAGIDDKTAVAGQLLVTSEVTSTLQGGGKRGYRVDAEGAAGGQLLVTGALTTQGVSDGMAQAGHLIAASREVASTLTASMGHHGHSSPRGDGTDNLVATFRKGRRAQNTEDFETWVEEDFANTLNLADNTGDVRATTLIADPGSLETGVRRLTPRECERLQGFPDDWTRYGHDGREMADSHRYRMMGNSVAVPVFEWLAKRLVAVDGRV